MLAGTRQECWSEVSKVLVECRQKCWSKAVTDTAKKLSRMLRERWSEAIKNAG
jgi:hypothetical protein